MKKNKQKTKRKIPSYWWDFEGDDEIIVKSDDDRFPIVARFKYDPSAGVEARGPIRSFLIQNKLDTKIGCAEKAIDDALSFIDELNSGRVSPKAC